ncbi:MAG: hypothetical protein JSV56_03660, partial [Methanomassiliicoccales archaeon]
GELDYGSLVTSGSFAVGAFTGSSILYRSSNKMLSGEQVLCGTCLDCGHIELYLNPQQLKSTLKKP